MGNFCSQCGSQLRPDSKFCDKCGTPVQMPSVQAASVRTGPAKIEPVQEARSQENTGSRGSKKASAGRMILTTLAMVILWVVQIVLVRKGIENPVTKALNFITFAKGSMNRGLLGYIGGTVGMGVVASAFVTLFGGGVGAYVSGFKNLFSRGMQANPALSGTTGENGYTSAHGETAAGARGSIGFLIIGVIAACVLYLLYTGSMGFSGAMAGVAGALTAVRALGTRAGGLYRFASKLTSKKTEGTKIKNPGAAKSLLSGAALGFVLVVAISGGMSVFVPGASSVSETAENTDGSLKKIISAFSGNLLQGNSDSDTAQTEDKQEAQNSLSGIGSDNGSTADGSDDGAVTEDFSSEAGQDSIEDALLFQETGKTPGASESDTDSDPGSTGSAPESSDYDQGMSGYTPDTYALSGGNWETMPSGEKVYTLADGSAVSNAWVKDGGSYYYVDYSGCLMRNNYSQDGFWAGDDGSWDEGVPARMDDPEPESGLKYGDDPVFTVEILNFSDGSHYAIATRSYSFGYSETFDVTPLGHGTYLLEGEDDFNSGFLMSVSEDRNTLIVSGYGTTESYSVR